MKYCNMFYKKILFQSLLQNFAFNLMCYLLFLCAFVYLWNLVTISECKFFIHRHFFSVDRIKQENPKCMLLGKHLFVFSQCSDWSVSAFYHKVKVYESSKTVIKQNHLPRSRAPLMMAVFSTYKSPTSAEAFWSAEPEPVCTRVEKVQ